MMQHKEMTDLKSYVEKRENEIKIVSSSRQHETSYTKKDTLRDDADIDYARVLYSTSFRRLQGKMQLLVPEHLYFYRNRLTHSLEVSQIARSIAKRIGLTDTLTVQTCSLAHDIGNPPFGHAGEGFLNTLSKSSYEGNAQTFRTLTHIENKFNDCKGLNLTLRTLLGVVKYPNNKKTNSNKFLYDNDYETINKWAEKYDLNLKTIDCEIMDLADEIAYAAHDLEDALRMRYFTIDDLLFEFSINDEFKNCKSKLENLVQQVKDYASKASNYKTSEEYTVLFHKKLTSEIVNLLVIDIDLINKKKLGYKNYKCIAKGLKKLTFEAIKRSPDVIQYEQMGKRVLTGLYEVFTDDNYNKKMVLLPAEYRNEIDKERYILDYIGGMMDSFAIDQYKLYFGQNSLDGLYKE